ncbi:MAG: Uma2 family endonuclease [Candidatus Cloacimonetes bacterium]|nr:Uma2 family endonuclease [Candidatus Cloacimonadota bacterium]
MARPQEKLKESYTYADYLTWDDEIRYELIDGVPYALAAPNTIHQRILRKLILIIGNHLEDKTCEMFFAPTEVRLFADENNKDHDVFQPDLFVICDKTKLDEKSYKGTPDFIIEILSPSTIEKDKIKKYNKYLIAKVPEYWIIEPENKNVSVFILDYNRYIHHIFGEKDKLSPSFYESCEIDIAEVFASVDIFEKKEKKNGKTSRKNERTIYL